MLSTVGVGVGEGVGAASIYRAGSSVATAGVGVERERREVAAVLSRPLRLVETMTMTARITATTRIRPKIICHLVLVSARS